MKFVVGEEVGRVIFGGRKYKVCTSSNDVLIRSSFRHLTHLGSCPDVARGWHSTPQVYDAGFGYLLAGAVSSSSQVINLAWWLIPIA